MPALLLPVLNFTLKSVGTNLLQPSARLLLPSELGHTGGPKGDVSPYDAVRQWTETPSRSGFSGDRIPDQMQQVKSK